MTIPGVPASRLPVVGTGRALAMPELLKVAGPEVLEDMLLTLANWSTKEQTDLIARYKRRRGEPWLGQDNLCAAHAKATWATGK
jgi:branched-chain amino acid transport system substrate-binding protein